jgi:endogenous inhibitor of DNA gyrase (YacG/DUF329 family)
MADLGRWLSEDYRVPGEGPGAALDEETGHDADRDRRAPGVRRETDTDD